jgi:hypothetical protein
MSEYELPPKGRTTNGEKGHCKMQDANANCPNAKCKLQIANCKLQIANGGCRDCENLQFSFCNFHFAIFILQFAILPAVKKDELSFCNLPLAILGAA